MFSKEIENKIHQLFEDMYKKTSEISETSFSTTEASERIMNYVSSRLSSDIEGYVVDLYSVFIDSLKKEEFFLDANNLNALYHLNLRDKILTTYRFDIKNLESYQKGIDYKEINRVYSSLGVAAGTFAIGGILKFALSSLIGIPFVVVIAGALAAACYTYFSSPRREKTKFNTSVKKFLIEMEDEVLNWFVDIEIFMNDQIRMLYK